MPPKRKTEPKQEFRHPAACIFLEYFSCQATIALSQQNPGMLKFLLNPSLIGSLCRQQTVRSQIMDAVSNMNSVGLHWYVCVTVLCFFFCYNYLILTGNLQG